MRPLLLAVSVGSDHHPFDRLITWLDHWLEAVSPDDVRCVMQYGTAAAPKYADALAFMPHDELLELLTIADVVVTQGGPMGILEARRCGTKPIAVPRQRSLGEVVDDHQFDFCRLLATDGKLVLAEDEAALHRALDDAVRDPASLVVDPGDADATVAQSVRRFSELVADLAPRRRPRNGPDSRGAAPDERTTISRPLSPRH